ncbi:hypothetical protein C0431_01390 [bacterium]|jgi:PAS domain S-box-containing protein|nr:hypothetical protein [bacterium]
MDSGILQTAITGQVQIIGLSLALTLPFLFKKSKSDKNSTTSPIKQVDPIAELRAEVAALQAENAALRIDLHQIQSIQGATLERFRTTFYEIPLPCFTVNDQGHVIEWNRACEAFFNLPEHQAIDRPMADILGQGIFRNDAEGMIYMVFLGMNPQPIEIELQQGEQTRVVKWFASPIMNRSGQVVGALNTLAIIPKNEISNQN